MIVNNEKSLVTAITSLVTKVREKNDVHEILKVTWHFFTYLLNTPDEEFKTVNDCNMIRFFFFFLRTRPYTRYSSGSQHRMTRNGWFSRLQVKWPSDIGATNFENPGYESKERIERKEIHAHVIIWLGSDIWRCSNVYYLCRKGNKPQTSFGDRKTHKAFLASMTAP
jgi:hypothetical protein